MIVQANNRDGTNFTKISGRSLCYIWKIFLNLHVLVSCCFRGNLCQYWNPESGEMITTNLLPAQSDPTNIKIGELWNLSRFTGINILKCSKWTYLTFKGHWEVYGCFDMDHHGPWWIPIFPFCLHGVFDVSFRGICGTHVAFRQHGANGRLPCPAANLWWDLINPNQHVGWKWHGLNALNPCEIL